MKRKLALLLLLATVLAGSLATGGCSKRYRIEIQSDTCWDGQIDEGQGIFDCGNSSYKVIGALRCVRVQKKTAAGYVRVRIDSGPWAETSEPNGIVQVCR
ncbi:MAG: hypothetical protein IT347_04880 [Candidatus Eisenbacteria bacterium]|nr:hypothetical protein [Candidatus Eisenbacteria bacterium]